MSRCTRMAEPALQLRRTGVALAAVVVAWVIAACAAPEQAPRDAIRALPAVFPTARYSALRADGKAVYDVDPTRSRAVILVRRAGALARFGHDHAIASRDITGSIAPGEGRADLLVPLDRLVVDEPALRDEAGLATQPSPADIAATGSNMRDKVLETARHPYALVTVTGVEARAGPQTVRAALSLHGVTRNVDVALELARDADVLTVSGRLAIEQSDFGIVPFSILGGAIAVQDRLDIDFRIRAQR